MPPELAPWALFAGFVAALGAAVIAVIRGLTTGRIVAGRHYEDARMDEARWQAVAEAHADTNRELAGHVGRLTSALEQQTAALREQGQLMHQLVHRLVPPDGAVAERAA